MTTILATKLHTPLPRPDLVHRRCLIQRLNAGWPGKLTLVSAPAGFGKTTLLCAWLAERGRPAAWLSLDKGDSDPARFLLHLIAALQTVAPDVGKKIGADLRSTRPPSTASILSDLLNDLSALSSAVTLVLDDYHTLTDQGVDAALSFLLEHLPPQLHLVIATREDPGLPLARLRAHGQLRELRAADLRFALAETAEFLNRTMALGLPEASVAALNHRTEGWIAGLQLAALSMQGRENLPAFVQAFAGDHRYIVDYLMEEVLQRQPAAVRTFLLRTSILERLCGPLCDAVTGQNNGGAQLEALERGNFFVVPLDDQRRWYRYHHLFGDFLQMHLKADQPGEIRALHRQASLWFEREDGPTDAVRHALAGQDVERAADLIERAVPALRRSRQESTVLGWLSALPDHILRHRPVLGVYYAGALLMAGQQDGIEERLREAEQGLAESATMNGPPGATAPGRVIVDRVAFQSASSLIALYRAALALSAGNVAATMAHAQQVLDLASPQDQLHRGAASGLLGLAFWMEGKLREAQRSYREAMVSLHRAGHISDAIGCAIAVADLNVERGQLRAAMAVYEQGLEWATLPDGPALRGAADMHVGLSALSCERHDLNAAMQHLSRSQALGESNALPQNPFRWCRAQARVREIEGDLGGALALLGEAERLYAGDLFPDIRPLAAHRARIWIRQGNLEAAFEWSREQQLTAEDDLTYLREFEHVTLARLLLAAGQEAENHRLLLQASGLLERLLEAARSGERARSVTELLVLQALTFHKLGNRSGAHSRLESALELAGPQQIQDLRIFLDEGEPIAAMLRKLAKQGIATNASRQLLNAFQQAAGPAPVKAGMFDALSERELEVLRLLRTGRSGPDLARTLSISLNTLRTHTRNIYGKLGVNTRRAAVLSAEARGLI